MIKKVYEKYVLPRMLDACCSTKPINYQRNKIVPIASGTVLEIGIGSGLNIPYYQKKDIQKIYVNRGPGSFAGIRNSLSIVKAINVARNVDYYCYSLEDFKDQKDVKYEDIPNLCDKFKIKKNLIKPLYLS